MTQVSLSPRSRSEHAQPSAVLGCTHNEWWGLSERLSWHDLTQNDVCRLHGRRQRCLQRELNLNASKCCCEESIGANQLSPGSFHLSGRLWQPSGLLGRGPWFGVLGSGMRLAQLPRSLRQTVWVPLLDRGHPTGLLLKKSPPPYFPLYSPNL